MSKEIATRSLTGDVLPSDSDQPTSITLTVEEAYALWHDSQDDVDQLGHYWEHGPLARLVDRLKTWHKTEAPW